MFFKMDAILTYCQTNGIWTRPNSGVIKENLVFKTNSTGIQDIMIIEGSCNTNINDEILIVEVLDDQLISGYILYL